MQSCLMFIDRMKWTHYYLQSVCRRSWIILSSLITPSCNCPTFDSTHLIEEVVLRGPVLLIEMSQDAVVSTGLTKIGWRQCVHRWLSLLGRVGWAVGGRLEEEDRGQCEQPAGRLKGHSVVLSSTVQDLTSGQTPTSEVTESVLTLTAVGLNVKNIRANSISWGRSCDLIESSRTTKKCYSVRSLTFFCVLTSTWELSHCTQL